MLLVPVGRCVTNVCCESTARDAKTVMVSDGNAAANDEEHAHALIAFYLNFGDVLTVDQTIAALRTQMPHAASA